MTEQPTNPEPLNVPDQPVAQDGPRRLSLRRKEIPLELEDHEGVVKPYRLIEVVGDDRDAWLDNVGRRTKYNAEGKSEGMTTFKELQASLIAKSLFTADGGAVRIETIQKFPASTQNELFKMAKELSDLEGTVGKDKPKNV